MLFKCTFIYKNVIHKLLHHNNIVYIHSCNEPAVINACSLSLYTHIYIYIEIVH